MFIAVIVYFVQQLLVLLHSLQIPSSLNVLCPNSVAQENSPYYGDINYKYPLYLLQSFWNIFQRELCNVVAWQFPMLISSLLCIILSSVSTGENCNCNFPIVKLFQCERAHFPIKICFITLTLMSLKAVQLWKGMHDMTVKLK